MRVADDLIEDQRQRARERERPESRDDAEDEREGEPAVERPRLFDQAAEDARAIRGRGLGRQC